MSVSNSMHDFHKLQFFLTRVFGLREMEKSQKFLRGWLKELNFISKVYTYITLKKLSYFFTFHVLEEEELRGTHLGEGERGGHGFLKKKNLVVVSTSWNTLYVYVRALIA